MSWPPRRSSTSSSTKPATSAEPDFASMSEREFAIYPYSRLDLTLGLSGAPLRRHTPCAVCGQRGPVVPVFTRWSRAERLSLTDEAARAAGETFVCADGCPRSEVR